MEITVGALAKKFGLSRTALLYYDSIGLLSPATRKKGEYRYYTEEDERRLARICQYRQAGIPLKDIAGLLDSQKSNLAAVLHQRFDDLNREIQQLYDQQRLVARLLQSDEILTGSKVINKKRWVSILEASGYSEEDMRKWHIGFEARAPEKHLEFLRYLGLGADEIEEIRSWGARKCEKQNLLANDNHS